MSKIMVSLSSNSDNREIDKYHDSSSGSSYSNSNSSSSSSNSGGNTMDEQYTSVVPGVPLEAFQEELRTRIASGSQAGTSTSSPLSTSSSEEETIYSCAVDVPSKTYFPKKLALNPRQA